MAFLLSLLLTSGGGLYDDDSSMMWILSVVRFRCGGGFLLGMRLIVFAKSREYYLQYMCYHSMSRCSYLDNDSFCRAF